MDGVGGVDDVEVVFGHAEVFARGDDAVEFDAVEFAEFHRELDHAGRKVGGRDLRAEQREIDGGLAEARADIEQALAGERPHLADDPGVFHRGRRLEGLAHAHFVQVRARGPLVVKVGLAVMDGFAAHNADFLGCRLPPRTR